jgi:hypothetical protein
MAANFEIQLVLHCGFRECAGGCGLMCVSKYCERCDEEVRALDEYMRQRTDVRVQPITNVESYVDQGAAYLSLPTQSGLNMLCRQMPNRLHGGFADRRTLRERVVDYLAGAWMYVKAVVL